MKTIDRNKDYYDYLSGIYGIDNQIIFDRRNSVVLDKYCWSKMFPNHKYELPTYFRKYGIRNFNRELVVLECGFVQYLILLEIDEKNQWSSSIVRVFQDDMHYKPQAMTIYSVTTANHYLLFVENIETIHFDKLIYANDLCEKYGYIKAKRGRVYGKLHADIELPILQNTEIPSLIPANEIWCNIYNYLLFQKEPKIIDSRTDKQKLESRGFDNITSFRHPTK